MIVDMSAVARYFRARGEFDRARAVEDSYFRYAQEMTRGESEIVCELKLPNVEGQNAGRKLLEEESLRREVLALREDVDALKAGGKAGAYDKPVWVSERSDWDAVLDAAIKRLGAMSGTPLTVKTISGLCEIRDFLRSNDIRGPEHA